MPSLFNIAAVFAVAAAGALAYAAYRRSTGGKEHDLRAELRAEQESLRDAIEALPRDLSEVELLRSQFSAADSDHNSLSDMDVEIELVEILALSLRASALAEKYASISVHEADRETRHDDAEALLREASQYSLNNPGPSIVESVV